MFELLLGSLGTIRSQKTNCLPGTGPVRQSLPSWGSCPDEGLQYSFASESIPQGTGTVYTDQSDNYLKKVCWKYAHTCAVATALHQHSRVVDLRTSAENHVIFRFMIFVKFHQPGNMPCILSEMDTRALRWNNVPVLARRLIAWRQRREMSKEVLQIRREEASLERRFNSYTRRARYTSYFLKHQANGQKWKVKSSNVFVQNQIEIEKFRIGFG